MSDPVPIDQWTPQSVTVRQALSHRGVSVLVSCSGCRLAVEVDLFRIGSRLADMPIYRLRFKCQRCGAFAREFEVMRARHGFVDRLFSIQPQPVWDEGCEKAQERALKRIEARAGHKGAGESMRLPRGS